MAKRTSIEDDTPIIPAIIAQIVTQEVIADSGLRNTAEVILVHRANTVYRTNDSFAKDIRRSANRGRDHLYMFMRHWLAAWLKEKAPAVFRSLPYGYSNGEPPPRGFLPVEVPPVAQQKSARRPRVTRSATTKRVSGARR